MRKIFLLVLFVFLGFLWAKMSMVVYTKTEIDNYALATIDSITFDDLHDDTTLSPEKKMVINIASEKVDYIITAIDSITFKLIVPAGMKLIPAENDTFIMGDNNVVADEIPSHKTLLTSNFFMDSTEVTQKHYHALMSASYKEYCKPIWTTFNGIGDDKPAYFVTWFDAVLFCNARSNKDGKDSVYSYTSITGTTGKDCFLDNIEINLSKNGYRLPSEAEWRYACNGTSRYRYIWHQDAEPKDYAWFNLNAEEEFWTIPHAAKPGVQSVAIKKPNVFGLYDMSGNVWEWCNDWFERYSRALAINPTGATDGTQRIIRGAGWFSELASLRCANRNYSNPLVCRKDFGFRTILPVQ